MSRIRQVIYTDVVYTTYDDRGGYADPPPKRRSFCVAYPRVVPKARSMISAEAVIVVVGWLVSLAVAIKAVPYLAAKRVSEQFGLTLVEQGGKKFYAPVDPQGEPVKIPIGVQTDDEGNQTAVMGYAPLAFCLPYMAAEMAAVKVKMTLFNAKSQISKKMQKEGLSLAMQEGGGLEAVLPFLPKKAQVAAALLQAAMGARSSQNANSAQTTPQGYRHSPGGEK